MQVRKEGGLNTEDDEFNNIPLKKFAIFDKIVDKLTESNSSMNKGPQNIVALGEVCQKFLFSLDKKLAEISYNFIIYSTR